ncbi:MAG: hypothetical protein PHH37_08310 [Paludibacter sp.]|nr:hypothetical protein [Paludibacter sp.]
METEKKLTGEVTPEQIAAWKAKYGKVHGVIVDGHIAYVRKIDRATTSYALSQMSIKMLKGEGDTNDMEMSMGKLFKTGEAVMTNCWLGGSEEIKNDPSLWMNACIKAGELIEFKESELKNF